MSLCSDHIMDFKAPACSNAPNPFKIVEEAGRYTVFDLAGNEITDLFIVSKQLNGLVTFEHKESGNRYFNA